jgi:hypothetical protein
VELKDLGEAISLYAEVLAIRRARLGNQHHLVSESARKLGLVLMEAKRFTESEPLLLESFEIYSSAFGQGHETTVSVAKDIAKLYEDWNRPEDASIWRQKLTIATNTNSNQSGG